MQRREDAIKRGHISQMALKSLKNFHKKTLEKLARRISCFSVLLKKETDEKKRCRITRWIAEWKKEQRALYHGWTHSTIRRELREEFPATTREHDKVFSKLNRDNSESDDERKYREAGRLINRLKPAR